MKLKCIMYASAVTIAASTAPAVATTLSFEGTVTDVEIIGTDLGGLFVPSIGDSAASVFDAFGIPDDFVSFSDPATGVSTTFVVSGSDIASGFDVFVGGGSAGAFDVTTTTLRMSGLSFDTTPILIAPNTEFMSTDQFITYTFGETQAATPDNASELFEAVGSSGTVLSYGYRGVVLFDGGASATEIRVEAEMALVEPVPLPASALLLGSTMLAGAAWRRRESRRA